MKHLSKSLLRLKGEFSMDIGEVVYTIDPPEDAMSFGNAIFSSWGSECAGLVAAYLPTEDLKKGMFLFFIHVQLLTLSQSYRVHFFFAFTL